MIHTAVYEYICKCFSVVTEQVVGANLATFCLCWYSNCITAGSGGGQLVGSSRTKQCSAWKSSELSRISAVVFINKFKIFARG
jgi:hypothetical protein